MVDFEENRSFFWNLKTKKGGWHSEILSKRQNMRYERFIFYKYPYLSVLVSRSPQIKREDPEFEVFPWKLYYKSQKSLGFSFPNF